MRPSMIWFVPFLMRTVAKRGSVITLGITLLAYSWIVVVVMLSCVVMVDCARYSRAPDSVSKNGKVQYVSMVCQPAWFF